MSLRRRLLLTLGLSFCVLWALAAAWLYSNLHDQMRQTLDQRLAASARMVAGLVAQLPEDAWAQAAEPMLSIPQSSGVACQISSPAGEVLMRTQGDFAGQLDAPVAGFVNRNIDGQHWRVFTYIQNGLHITTADRLAERVMLQRNVIVVAALPFGIRRGLRPLEHLRSELARRDPETLTPVTIVDAPAELEPVVDTLNRLLVLTREALRREQRFTSDAAHELRTPLTAIKTHVQLALRVPADQTHEAMSRAEAGIARLQRTLDQLLMLARLEVDQAGNNRAQVNSTSIVETALADLENRERVVMVEHDSESVAVGVPHELAAAALRNLLENALRHTHGDEPVALEVQAGLREVVFTIRDRGDWPAEQSTHNLTQRFWRHGRGQGNGQGSGLGLAIVATITERYGGALEFTARDGGGLVARLSLPAKDHNAR